MNKIKNIFIYLIPILISIVSCTNSIDQPKTAEEIIQGNWICKKVELNNGYVDTIFNSNEDFLTLSKKESSYVFSDNEDSGSWILRENQLTLSSVPKNQSVAVDSVLWENNYDGEASIKLKNREQTIGKIENGKLYPEKVSTVLTINKLSDNELIIDFGEGKTYFQKQQIKETSWSISSIVRGLLGICFFVFFAWIFSADRKNINWALIAKGIILQLVIAVMVLKIPIIERGFDAVSGGFVTLISFTDYGFNFLFSSISTGEVASPMLNFAFKILPTIVFFSALVSLFYYWGILQKVVYVFAWIMKKFMKLSGAESLAAAGNVFLGQTEAPLLVKPYLNVMTKSEIMCLMTGGMATIAGGVLAAYVGFLGGDDPIQQAFFAKHLLTASIISAPAAIVAAKILVPETEKYKEDLTISKEKLGSNALEAISNGTSDGLKLAINVGAMLLVFIALMALCNAVMGWFGGFFSINELIAANTPYEDLSFEFLLGYIGRPLVWIMGIDWADSLYVGELLGIKTVLNEFVAYPRLGEFKEMGLISERSVIMSTYLLCGFANFASIGIQIGGIGALIPSRKGLLSKLGMRALIGGTVACILTATVVGMTL
jgi:concentrative nucleoside transporter, CNT family